MFKLLVRIGVGLAEIGLILFVCFVLAQQLERARAGLLLTHAGLAGSAATAPINPGTVAGLAMWYDPSLASSVFNDTACTVAAANLDHVGCIKDQSTHGCNMTQATPANGPIWNVVTPGSVAYLQFTGAENLKSTCQSVLQNVPRAIGFGAVLNTAPTIAGGPLLYISTNSTGSGRFIMTYSSNSSVGWMVRARNADGDTGVNAAVGTNDPGTAPVAMRADAEYINASNNLILFINNGLAATQQTGTVSSNSSNTASADPVIMGQDATAATVLTGNLYQLFLYTPASALSGATMTGLDSYSCSKAGVSC